MVGSSPYLFLDLPGLGLDLKLSVKNIVSKQFTIFIII